MASWRGLRWFWQSKLLPDALRRFSTNTLIFFVPFGVCFVTDGVSPCTIFNRFPHYLGSVSVEYRPARMFKRFLPCGLACHAPSFLEPLCIVVQKRIRRPELLQCYQSVRLTDEFHG